MPPLVRLNGFCRGMALRRASFSSSIGKPLSSTQTPVSVDTELRLRSPATSVASDNELPKILSTLTVALEYLISRNEQELPIFKSSFIGCQMGPPVLPLHNGQINSNFKLTLFHGIRVPSIGIQKYLERIYKYTNCSPSCFVVAYAYMDQLVHRQPDQPIISLNVHRLLITSVMLAAKTLDDVHYNNAFYARVGGISITELNRMELDLLFQLDFRLCVTIHTFESYCVHLEQEFCNIGPNLVMAKGLPDCTESENFRMPVESDTLHKDKMISNV